ncbi:23093_t:CDS:1, partial [Rhizophagus irregularis]
VPDKPDKLDKFLAGGDIILNCLIPREGRNIFNVTISNANNNRVSSLAEAIRICHLDRFQDIDSTSLALYKVAFISDSVVIHNLSNNEYFKVEGAERMEPQDRIFTHFFMQPQQIYGGEKGINVIMYPSTERVPKVLSKDN